MQPIALDLHAVPTCARPAPGKGGHDPGVFEALLQAMSSQADSATDQPTESGAMAGLLADAEEDPSLIDMAEIACLRPDPPESCDAPTDTPGTVALSGRVSTAVPRGHAEVGVGNAPVIEPAKRHFPVLAGARPVAMALAHQAVPPGIEGHDMACTTDSAMLSVPVARSGDPLIIDRNTLVGNVGGGAAEAPGLLGGHATESGRADGHAPRIDMRDLSAQANHRPELHKFAPPAHIYPDALMPDHGAMPLRGSEAISRWTASQPQLVIAAAEKGAAADVAPSGDAMSAVDPTFAEAEAKVQRNADIAPLPRAQPAYARQDAHLAAMLRETVIGAVQEGTAHVIEVETGVERFGKLGVSLQMHDGTLHVTLLSTRADAIEMMRRSLGAFLRDLADHGVRNVDVQLASPGNLTTRGHLHAPMGPDGIVRVDRRL